MSKFLNMIIEGDPYIPSGKTAKQLTEGQITSLFQDVLSHPEVLGIGWTQYTPYFNDGEPCVFSASDPYIVIEGSSNEDYSADYGWMEYDFEETGRMWLSTYDPEFKRLVGSRTYRWVDGERYHKDDIVNAALYNHFMALYDAMNDGACDNVLLSKFGDHAVVIIDPKASKVTVDTYEHD